MKQMEQKNTIVKCKAHPNCLFNHNGICNNYVINIGTDGKCECYVEADSEYDPPNAQEIIEYAIKLEQEKMRGQRTEGNFYDDVCDYAPFLTKAICSQCKYDTHGNLCSRKNVASNGIWTCWEKKE